MELQRNPAVDAALLDAIVALWVRVTNAGGAVGFLPGVAEAEVRATALRALEAVRRGDSDLIVARKGGGLAGFAFLETGAHPLAPHVGTVKRLQRDPRYRGAGIGAALLATVEQVARERGLSLLTLTVRGGTGREAFYLAHGYRIDGRLPGRLRLADGRLVEEIHMSKPLMVTGEDAAAPAALQLRVRRLDPDLPLPRYAQPGDAGLDLHAAMDVRLEPGERAVVPTGIAIAVPPGHVGLVHPRSGLAARAGVGIVNAPGTIDAGYRGEVKVILINHDPRDAVTVHRGDRIAQLLVQRVERVEVVAVDALDGSERGEGGFGSTGR